ncbi:hypothetical protein L0657_24055 [Dyadobacter sp. CY345]|uniref:hypothetical protein n=1 Tax=Dyadobacter sp. CY345 TaxID=2909335 RepID=UPI001F290DA8|nr:hypothetical protein [Dyadobacter sp. CY345]MCF2447049.1 hypothetical protein [Dyadobacter sp. CY345]
MISSQVAFNYGFNTRSTISKSSLGIKDFSLKRVHYLIVFFTIAGLIPMFFYQSLTTVYGGVNVILGIFRSLGTFGFIISLIHLEKYPKIHRKLILLCTIVSGIPLFFFAYFVKGSREGLFALALFIALFLSTGILRKYSRMVSISFFLVFLLGSFVAGSITDIRRTNNYKEEGASDITQIEYLSNFVNSIVSKDITNGMDLGNGAILIDHVSANSTYDYGAGFWNGFIYNYFPSRYFGDDFKNAVYIKFSNISSNEALEKRLTRGISTRTGFFDAFRSFSVFAFIPFLFFGILLNSFQSKSKLSMFYLFVYVSCLAVIPNMLTHSFQYLLGRLELIFIILFPILYFFTHQKKRNVKMKASTLHTSRQA